MPPYSNRLYKNNTFFLDLSFVIPFQADTGTTHDSYADSSDRREVVVKSFSKSEWVFPLVSRNGKEASVESYTANYRVGFKERTSRG